MLFGYRLANASVVTATLALSAGLLTAAGAEEVKKDANSGAASVSSPAPKENKPGDESSLKGKGKAAAKHPAPWAGVDSRMVRIEHRLLDAVSSGRLTSKEAGVIRSELDQVTEMEAIFRALPANASMWHVIALEQELDRITDLMERSMRDRTVASTDLVFTKDDTTKRIDTAAREGRLTAFEVQELKQEYNRLIALEHVLRQTKGKLSYSDRLMLCIDFDHLGARVRRQMSPRTLMPPDVERTTQALEKRIDEESVAGKLPADTVTNLKGQIKELRDTARANEDGKKGLEPREQVALGLWLEMIANRVDEAVLRSQKQLPMPEDLVKELDKKIGVGLARGALTPLEALELKEDLDLLDRAVVKGYSSADEETVLRLGLARLDGFVDRQFHASTLLWPGVRSYQAHQDARIKEGLAAQRLTADEAKSLQGKADAIARSIDEIRDANGYYAQSALKVTIALERLSAELDKTLKDRAIELPKLDALRKTIDHRLGDAVVSGDLSIAETEELRSELEKIGKLEEQYKVSDNSISSRETLALAVEAQRLALALEEQSHDHTALFPGLDHRRTQIEELINEGLASGRLTEAEGKTQREMLSTNSAQEKTFRAASSGITASSGLELVNKLESQYDTLDRKLRDEQITSADLVSQVGAVERKIAQGTCMGYLTLSESRALRSQFDTLLSTLIRLRSQKGGLSYGERLALSYGASHLAAATERQLRSTPLPIPNIDSRRAELEQSIAQAMAAGKLPAREALDLKSLSDEIARSTNAKRMSGGGISYAEALVALTDLDRLNDRLNKRIKAQKEPLPDIDTRQATLEKKIKDAAARGKLSREDAERFHADLERIADSELAFRTSDEVLSFAESASLVMELEQLARRLDRQLRTPRQAATRTEPKLESKSESKPEPKVQDPKPKKSKS